MPRGIYPHSLTTWTEEEIATLRQFAGVKCARELAKLVNHTRFAVLKKMEALGIKGFRPHRAPWPDSRIEALLREAPVTTTTTFCKRHGVTMNSARFMARKLGVRFSTSDKVWTDEEHARVVELARTHTSRQIAEVMNRSLLAVRKHGFLTGIQFHRTVRPAKPRSERFWTDEELDMLRKCAGMTLREAAQRIGRRSLRSVEYRGYREGIRFEREIREERIHIVQAKPVREKKDRAPRPPKPERLTRAARVREVKPKPPTVAKKLAAAKVVSRIEYCPACHAPVSNWAEHFARRGHPRPTPTMRAKENEAA